MRLSSYECNSVSCLSLVNIAGGIGSPSGDVFWSDCLTLYHDPEYREHDVDAEACWPIERPAVKGEGHVFIRELPEVKTMACVVHHGPFTTLSQAYSEFLLWTQANGYRVAGPDREIYLYTGNGQQIRQDDPSYVTEIQVPVEKT